MTTNLRIAAAGATRIGLRNSAGEAIRRAIQDGLRHGAPERIAERLDRSRRWVYDELEGRADAALDLLAESLSEVSDTTALRILTALGEPRGIVSHLSGVTEPKPVNVLSATSEALRAMGVLADAVGSGLTDGRLEPNEVSAILTASYQLRERAAELERAVLGGGR